MISLFSEIGIDNFKLNLFILLFPILISVISNAFLMLFNKQKEYDLFDLAVYDILYQIKRNIIMIITVFQYFEDIYFYRLQDTNENYLCGRIKLEII